MTERRAQVRLRIAEAGQPPTSTYSHWLMPTNAVSSRNQGETSAASSALMSVTLPASANSTRSSGQEGVGVVAGMSSGSFQECVELCRLAVQVAADLLAQVEDRLVGDRVDGEVALLAPRDDACAQQHAQVLGDVLLRGTGRLLELLHRRLTVAQRVEQPDPHRLAQDAKALCDQLDQGHRKGVGDR